MMALDLQLIVSITTADENADDSPADERGQWLVFGHSKDERSIALTLNLN